MAVASTNFVKRIHLAIAPYATMFRVNTGLGWIGSSFKATKAMKIELMPGDVVIRQARPLHAGLVKGGLDLIGWREVIITPEMIGQKIAQFVAQDPKYGTGRASPQQLIFIRNVRDAGGIAGTVKSEEEAIAMLK